MIVYKLDKQAQAAAITQIKDMQGVIDEIAPSLQVLQKLLAEHRQAISMPSLDAQCISLQQAVDGATKLTKVISENSRELCVSSDQAAKRLLALDESPNANRANQSYTSRTRVQV